MDRIKGVMMVIVSAMGYGLMPLFASWATAAGSSVEMMLFGRFFLASLFLGGHLLIHQISFKIELKDFFLLLLIGGVGLVATTQMLFYSYRLIAVSQATALHFIYPVAVVIFAIGLKLERLNTSKIVALFLAILGVWFLTKSSLQQLNLMGIILALCSGITYAVYVVGVALPRIARLSRWLISFYTSLIASFCYLVLAAFQGNFSLQYQLSALGGIFALALISTVLAQIFLMRGIAIIGPFQAAILSTFEPLVGILVGLVIFAEQLNVLNYLGMFLIIAALILVILGREISRRKLSSSRMKSSD
ncbi:MAG: DMT family transporter [Candidatus Cloacimonadales bacterium]